MAFKDNLSKLAKTVGDGAATVAKKSGDVVEITKLNLSIQSEEDKIEAMNSEIGIIIYKKYENGDIIDKDLLDICQKIKNSHSKILELKQKVLDIKKVKLCINCKSELPPEIIFCPKCGTKQE